MYTTAQITVIPKPELKLFGGDTGASLIVHHHLGESPRRELLVIIDRLDMENIVPP